MEMMKMIGRLRLRRLLGTCACAAAVTVGALLSTAPAASATILPTASDAHSFATNTLTAQDNARAAGAAVSSYRVGAAQSQSVTPDSACPVSAFGYGGEAVCGSVAMTYKYPDSHQEAFIIGINYAIWHAWKGSNGWHSLGGTARAASPTGVWLAGTFNSGKPIIDTYGTNNGVYCDNWGSPAWSGWYACG
jgi:hypothetical protein